MMKRLLWYIIGIFLFAMGVALAIKSNLGVSPVSTVPYVASLMTGQTVGTMTATLYVLFVALQWLILGKSFRPKESLQLVFAVAFGSFVDMSRFLIKSMGYSNLLTQVIYLIGGTLLIAFGIFLILKSKMIVSPTDGLVKAIAQRFKLEFPKVKIGFDLGAAMVATVLSYLFLGQVEGVGIGTIFSAVAVGACIRLFDQRMGHWFALGA